MCVCMYVHVHVRVCVRACVRACVHSLQVMEWIEGERLTSPALPEEIKTELVRAMVQCSLQQVRG